MRKVGRVAPLVIGLLFVGGLLSVLDMDAQEADTELALSRTVADGIAAQERYAVGEVVLAEIDGAVASIAAGDLDLDGDLDLVSDGLTAWENPYSATFSSPWVSATLAAGVSAQETALGDLDRDGDLDVVAVGGFGLAIWQNPLTQSASTPFGTWPVSHVLTTAQTIVNDVVVADLDGDRALDIVAVRGYSLDAGWLCAWQNPGVFTGTWSSNVLTSTRGFQAVAAGDLDGDGWIDLVTGSGLYASPNEIRAWQNDGSPFTDTWPSYQVIDLFQELGSDNVNSALLADLDGDARLDIVAGYQTSPDGNVGIWRNLGTPFTMPWSVSLTMATSERIWRVAAGDLDGDGDSDVVGASAFGPSGNEVIWGDNDGTPFDGEWPFTQVRQVDVMPRDLLLADLSKNGDLETVVALDTVFGGGGEPRIVAYRALWEHVYLPAAVRDAP